MRYQFRPTGGDNKEPVPRPTRCPACRSTDVTTTSAVPNAESYWRCGTCGEVWNAGRRESSTR